MGSYRARADYDDYDERQFDFIERVMRRYPNEWLKVSPLYGDGVEIREELGRRFNKRLRGEVVMLAERDGSIWATFLAIPTVLGEQPRIFAL
jgi:hypothetical protein